MTKLTPPVLLAAVLVGCGSPAHTPEAAANAEAPSGPVHTVRDTVIEAAVWAAGSAEPMATATLATKLMGTVTEVLVREGDLVDEGQLLLRIDARELAAKRAQVEAGIREAEAMVAEATAHAERMRNLFAEEAAPQAQLDQAETGLARAEAGLRTARAGAAELDAMASYANLRAPFAGVVTERLVDPGAFATPGTPLLTLTDASRLRVTVTTSPDLARGLARGDAVQAVIEDVPATAVVEGVVPRRQGSLYTVNAVVDNASHAHMPGSAASLALSQGTRTAVLVPRSALVRRGDLVGVRLAGEDGGTIRWVRTGETRDGHIEVLSGLEPGTRILLGEGV